MPWTSVRENVRLPLKLAHVPHGEADARVSEALAQVGLAEFAGAYPRELSGGMKMRVSLARALVTDPDILLMDEPFAALDVQTRYQMQEFLLSIWQGSGKTVIFVTHHIDEAIFLADRVIVLTARPGRLLSSVQVDMPRPRNVASPEFDQHRVQFLESLRSEVAKAFAEQELAELLDTRVK